MHKRSPAARNLRHVTCVIGTSVVPRQNIAWIGLSLSQKLQATPPPVKNSADGRAAYGRRYDTLRIMLLGILRVHSVVMAPSHSTKKMVKWVHLAPVSATENRTRPKSIRTRDHQIPETPTTLEMPASLVAANPETQHRLESRHRRRPRPVVALPVHGRLAPRTMSSRLVLSTSLWGGGLRWILTGHSGCRGSRRAVLRFPLIPLGVNGVPWGMQLWGGFTAPEVHYELSTGGCAGEQRGDRTSSARHRTDVPRPA